MNQARSFKDIAYTMRDNTVTPNTKFYEMTIKVGTDLDLTQLHDEIKNVVIGLRRKETITYIRGIETKEVDQQ